MKDEKKYESEIDKDLENGGHIQSRISKDKIGLTPNELEIYRERVEDMKGSLSVGDSILFIRIWEENELTAGRTIQHMSPRRMMEYIVYDLKQNPNSVWAEILPTIINQFPNLKP